MSKWNCATEREWLNRVEIEAKRVALLISNGMISGPDIANRITTLVVQASTRRPVRERVS